MTLELFLQSGALVAIAVTALWLVSVVRRDASVVDPWWSMLFLLVTVHAALRTSEGLGLTPGKALLVALVAFWALRLWLHLLLRSRGQPEDARYAAFRAHYGPERYWWVSYFQVFLLQGCLALVISVPLQLAAAAPPPDALSAWDVAGAVLWLGGFACEAVADWQLVRFRRWRAAAPERAGAVLDQGLWRYSRHPNYFGEALLWWGFWVSGLDQASGWAWATVLAPALMTFLLVRVSGVRMLDAHLLATRPAYADYVRRTSAFVPWLPRLREGD